MMGIFRKQRDNIPTRLKKVNAVRCRYESEEVQRIEMTLESEFGEKVTMEISSPLAYKLISELQNAYSAIHPPLPKNPNPDRFL